MTYKDSINKAINALTNSINYCRIIKINYDDNPDKISFIYESNDMIAYQWIQTDKILYVYEGIYLNIRSILKDLSDEEFDIKFKFLLKEYLGFNTNKIIKMNDEFK